LRKIVTAPLAAVAPVHRHVRHAVKTGRLGNIHHDYGLDILTFCIAMAQTGFGPFVAIYLVASNWTNAQIGDILGVGTIVALVAQIPVGVAIDAMRRKRLATAIGLLGLATAAIVLALVPFWAALLGVEVVHGIASVVLVPAVAAVTLSRVGRAEFAQRLGRNTRFLALGSAIGAGVMGFAGAHVAPAAPFWLAAASIVPALLALWALPPHHKTQPPAPKIGARAATDECWRVLLRRPLVPFTLCTLLFQGANAFILTLAMSRLTNRIGDADTNLILAGCLIVAQFTVAGISPWVGQKAEAWGRKPILLLGFAAVPLHAGLLGLFGGAIPIIALQLLDGIGGAMFGVLLPLVAADISHGTNRFNLCISILGVAVGIGATFGNFVFGHLATHFGDSVGFLAMTGAGVIAFLAVFFLMPETKEEHEPEHATPPRTPRPLRPDKARR
jgi:MFS family permease